MAYLNNDYMFVGTASTTIANTSSETSAIPSGFGTKIVPGGVCQSGSLFRLKGGGIFSTLLVPGNLTVKIKLGSTTIASVVISNLLASATNNAFDFEGIMICRSAGASGTFVATGFITYETGTLARGTASLNSVGATVTIDTTADQAVDVSVQWDTASTSNTLTTVVATIEPFNI